MNATTSPLSPAMINGASIYQVFDALSERTGALREAVRKIASPPEGLRRVRLFRMAEAAQQLRVTERWLRQFVSEHSESIAVHSDEGGRWFSPQNLLEIRRLTGLSPLRAEAARATVLSVMNFKGGSGKSSTSVNLAQSIAARGYRVLVVDLDPQASASMCFDYVVDGVSRPFGDIEIDYDDTLGVILEPSGASSPEVASRKTVLSLARRTHWQNIDVIPACTALMFADFLSVSSEHKRTIHAAGPSTLPEWAARFKAAMASVTEYDVIVIDTPPAVNRFMLGVTIGSDILVVPVRCAQFDIDALASWIDVQSEWFAAIAARSPDIAEKLQLRFLLNDRSSQSRSETRIEAILRHFLEGSMTTASIPHLEALKRGGGSAPSVFDEPPKSPASFAAAAGKARNQLFAAFSDIHELIYARWVDSTAHIQLEN